MILKPYVYNESTKVLNPHAVFIMNIRLNRVRDERIEMVNVGLLMQSITQQQYWHIQVESM